MDDNQEQPNGVAHPPAGVITIAISLTPTPGGYAMAINVDPATVYPDTVIEACQRAIRTFERMASAQATVQAFQGVQGQARSFNRETEAIRRRLS